MKKRLFLLLVIPFFIVSFSITSFASSALPTQKQTTLGLYITAKEAFTKWQVDRGKVKILDVRTSGEYIFVGHAPMATNIPLRFLKTGIDLKKMRPIMPLNNREVLSYN